MFDTLFGADVPLAVKFFLAFVIVLGLIGGTAWAVRRFGANRLGGGATRGRQPRLAVVDAATVDSRRRLVIIRRDNVEHLLMIGGPTDVVVETNIVRGGAQRDVHGAAPSRASGDALPRPVPLAEGSMWPLQPEPAPMPRPPRPAPPEPVQWPMPPTPEPVRQQQRPPELRPADTLAGLADELSSQPAPRPEPKRMPAAQSLSAETAAAPPEGDENLAEMAQRLEAALRKPGQAAVARSAPAARPAPTPAPEQRSTRASARMRAATAPAQAAAPPEPAPAAAAPEPARPDAAETKPAQEPKGGKTLYESLEQEMASLLGRPQDKG